MRNEKRRNSNQMLYKKTDVAKMAKKKSYTWYNTDGSTDTIKIDENGETRYIRVSPTGERTEYIDKDTKLTPEMLQELARADNREVENNLKHSHKLITPAEKKHISEWRNDPDHPERQRNRLMPDSYNSWNTPIEALLPDDSDNASPSDKSQVMMLAYMATQPEENPVYEALHEFVDTLPPIQQQVFQYHLLENRKQTETAKMLGITQQRVSAISKKLKQNIQELFKKAA